MFFDGKNNPKNLKVKVYYQICSQNILLPNKNCWNDHWVTFSSPYADLHKSLKPQVASPLSVEHFCSAALITFPAILFIPHLQTSK
jgi:hypothetical protein